MPAFPLKFGDTSSSVRLGYFDRMLETIANATDVGELHGSLVEIMRRMFGVSCYVEITNKDLPPSQYQVTRVWREDGTEGVPNCSPWRAAGVPVRTGGIVAEVIAQKQPSFVPSFSFPPDDPLFKELGEYHGMAATPGGVGQRDHWVFVFDACADRFTSATLEYLILRVMLIGSALRNLRTAMELDEAYDKLTIATAFIQSEVDRIAAIQRALLPPAEPRVPGLDVVGWSETYDRAGGDLYDYVALPTGQWAFLVGDASGHGPSGAVLAAILSTTLHALLEFPDLAQVSPAKILAFANEQFVIKRIEQSFVTAFIAVWDPQRRTLAYSRAGHNPPLFWRKMDGTTLELSDASGLPLGVFPQSEYDQHELGISPGDILVMFSDGIVEAETPTGEAFDLERLSKILADAADCNARELLSTIRAELDRHRQGARPADDQTVVVLRAI
jgi:phosphoserine phosphatase RsbU/P